MSLTIQSIIAQALEDDNHALMASLDLSAAFDTVNINLLLKRMRIMGLPDDLVDLVSVWLKDRFNNSSFKRNWKNYTGQNCKLERTK